MRNNLQEVSPTDVFYEVYILASYASHLKYSECGPHRRFRTAFKPKYSCDSIKETITASALSYSACVISFKFVSNCKIAAYISCNPFDVHNCNRHNVAQLYEILVS